MIKFKEMKIPDLDRHRGRLLIIVGMRIAFFCAILAVSIFYQLQQALFFHTDSLYPLYTLLFTAFVLDTIYLAFFEKAQKLWLPTAFLFFFDTIAITALILITGSQQSIFLFLYLVNIILCSFVFHRKGAFAIAVLTSVAFGFVLLVGPELKGQTLFYAVGLNNLAFFLVAALSGYLSEQMNFMGAEVALHKKNVKNLRDLNKIILENIGSGLMTLSEDFRIVVSNNAAHNLLGRENLSGENVTSVFKNFKSDFKDPNKRDSRFQMFYDHPQGKTLTLGFSVTPLKEEDGTLTGYIVIFQDLTEFIRLEEAMRRQEKLAAVGKLAAGIAHEIRNPLASISGSIELLKSMVQTQTNEETRLMDISLREISRLNGLITEFLDFVKPEDRKLDLVDIDSLLSEIMDMVKLNPDLPKAKQEVSLKGQCYVPGDQNKLKQVFLNFIINAYQAMNESPVKEIKVSTELKDESLEIKIKDSGHGMSDETRQRLFEPFFTTKPKGTGLGLATAHKILEIHQAEIFVESHRDKGTEFTIRFNEGIKRGASENESQNTGS